MLLYDVPACAAEARRPHDGAPAVSVQNSLPARQVIFLQPLSQAHLGADILGKLRLDEGAHLCSKCRFLGRVFQVHVGYSILPLWHPAVTDAGLLTSIN